MPCRLRTQDHGAGVLEFASCREPEPGPPPSYAAGAAAAALAVAIGLGAAPGGSGGGGTGQVLATVLAAALATALLVLSWLARGTVVEEAVIATQGFGLELRARRRGGGVSSDFVDASQIEGIVIAEAVTFFDVFYYIAIQVRGGDGREKLPFRVLVPRLQDLREVARGLRPLVAEESEKPSAAPE